ncbi:Anti-sigma B factor antagonist RsbV [hydrothermal vent metagenome]|uniref:Anti-sigma B factor antagonist RsbV n=1 Tax=hydrothermal vent metagenome TaxID=652676 RepID=A0A3B0Z9F5_9ZZZZ
MSISTAVSASGDTVTITISGRFDFSIHRDFRLAYEDAKSTSEKPSFVVDLSGTDYMDSSALGMLLLLREHAGGDESNIKISNCRPVIKEILDIANFDKLFAI